MPRLFFHIGLPKCATTTVQTWLAARRDDLAAAGLRYDFPPGLVRLTEGNGALLANSVLLRQPEKTADLLAFHLSQGPGDVLVSSEIFSALCQTRAMGDLAQAARDTGFDPLIIVYLRRQDHWIESDFKQQIKGGRGWTDPVEALIDKRIAQLVLNYAWTLAYWAKHVGRDNIRVILLEPGQAAEYPVRVLLAATGTDFPATPAPDEALAANVSPPTGLIEPARLLKQRLIAQGLDQDAVRAALARFFDLAPGLLDVPPRRFLLPLAARAALLRRVAGWNADVARDYLDGQGFATDLAADPASDTPLAPEGAALLDQWIAATRAAGLDDTGAPADPAGGSASK